MKRILLLFSILSVLIVGYVYFFMISPFSNSVITGDVVYPTKEQQVISFLGKMGFSDVHSNLFGEKPYIKVKIGSYESTFTVLDSNIYVEYGNPDILLIIDEETFESINKGSLNIEESLSDGKIDIRHISDEQTLAFKGFKVIYNRFQTTGKVTYFESKQYVIASKILAAFLLVIIIGIIIEKI